MVFFRPATIGLMPYVPHFFVLVYIRVAMTHVYSFMATAFFLHKLVLTKTDDVLNSVLAILE
jgi:hypothetical protein